MLYTIVRAFFSLKEERVELISTHGNLVTLNQLVSTEFCEQDPGRALVYQEVVRKFSSICAKPAPQQSYGSMVRGI
jgi:hypothetical protein